MIGNNKKQNKESKTSDDILEHFLIRQVEEVSWLNRKLLASLAFAKKYSRFKKNLTQKTMMILKILMTRTVR